MVSKKTLGDYALTRQYKKGGKVWGAPFFPTLVSLAVNQFHAFGIGSPLHKMQVELLEHNEAVQAVEMIPVSNPRRAIYGDI
jgi:hypothetical protein